MCVLPFFNTDFADHKKRKQQNNYSTKYCIYTTISMLFYGITVKQVNYG